jgi:hypothetical protein
MVLNKSIVGFSSYEYLLNTSSESSFVCVYLRSVRTRPLALCLKLLGALHGTHPIDPVLDKYLPLRLQLCLMQMKIIHR